jgi:NADH dehydrogenase
MTHSTTLPHVAVVGDGFGGLHAARALAGRPVWVTLLDRRNHHLFQPLLYKAERSPVRTTDRAIHKEYGSSPPQKPARPEG